MEIYQDEELQFTEEETECFLIIQKLMNDDEDLRPLLKFWTSKLVVIMVRSFNLDPHKVFRVLKRLRQCTVKFPQLFSLVDLAKLETIFAKKMFQIVDISGSSESPGILILRLNRWDPNDVSADEMLAASLLYIYEGLKNIRVQRKGGIFVVDAEGLEFSHVKQASFYAIRKLNSLVNAMPLRYLGCVIINSPPMVEKLFNIFKYVLREQTRKSIHIVHKNFKPLHDMVPARELLPISLGGEVEDDIGFVQGVEESMMRDTTFSSLVVNVMNENKLLQRSNS